MGNNRREIITSLHDSGVIGDEFSTLLKKRNTSSGTTTLIAIAFIAIIASLAAYSNALKARVPLVFEENGELYEVHPDGTKKRIRSLNKSNKIIPKKFTLD